MRPKPAILLILDGWGIAPPSDANPIAAAKTPVMDKLISAYPAMTLFASGENIGLSNNEPGNSEAGHLNIGAGKVCYEIYPKINQEIKNGAFFTNDAFLKACEIAKKNNSKLHLMGMVSSGGIHSHQDHLYALLELAHKEKVKNVFVHVFLDGKDTLYNTGKDYLCRLQDKMKDLKTGKIASLSGRFYSMDLDNRWERTEKAYVAIAKGQGERTTNPVGAIESSYKKKIFDEDFLPTTIYGRNGMPVAKVEDGDAVIFFNFGEDRARQITKAFVDNDFKSFKRKKILNLFFVAMTEYEKGLPVNVAYPLDVVEEPLAKIISENKLHQLHIAETEKYAHITFFLNGLKEDAFADEDRVVVPSLHVASYDKKPEMAARSVADRVIKEIKSEKYDFIAVNFANPDMVAHTGDFNATKKAIEVLDKYIGEITEQVLLYSGVLFITADHGNAESVLNLQTGHIDKDHSKNPVPFIIVGEKFEGQRMGLPQGVGSDLSLVPPVGKLADIAPTILHVLGLKKPPEMTGKPLI